MISGGSTPTVKKSRGRTSSARPRHSSTNHRSKNIADPADHRDVDHDRAERDGDAERDDGAAGLAAVVPDRPGVAHRATLGGSAGSSGAARRASATTGRGRGRSSSVTERSPNRRAETSTRDSNEPTAAL